MYNPNGFWDVSLCQWRARGVDLRGGAMGRIASFKAKYLKDGQLSIPREVVNTLLLRRGEEVRVMIEKEKFDKEALLKLFAIWKDKGEAEIDLYREILKEREIFGRGEVNL
jgi:hypothetical protein